MQSLISDLEESLFSYQDLNRKQFGERTYPSKMEIIGVTVPNVRKVLAELRTETKGFDVSKKFSLAVALINSPYFEMHQLGLDWVAKDKHLLHSLDQPKMEQLCVQMDNWVSVDVFAVLILGPLLDKKVVDSDYVLKLAAHENFWMRRMALASTVALNKRTSTKIGASDLTLTICEKVISDRHEMVVKALSWALRTLITWDREGVSKFLEVHQSVLNKRVLREVNHKLTTGLKT